ncbi:ferritin family protein [Arthrobacter halodurans]|uniref:Ferritin-like domain-containing protein n=1 Tax=Arthrobacter halodurans TaxID=516699 RepID=A0ABV4URC9_9MICC
MGFEQYHEPPAELSAETRTFARMCANLTEEAEAIGWYQQRISLETDPVARAIMEDSLGEEFKHFCMELEYLFRAKPQWGRTARGTLFQEGDIVVNGRAAEEAAGPDGGPPSGTVPSGNLPAGDGAPPVGPPPPPGSGSLGIGSLKGNAS